MTDSGPHPAQRLRRIAAAAILALACGSGGTQLAAQDEAADIDGPAAVGDRILQVGGGFDIALPRPRSKPGDLVASPMPAVLNSDIWRLGRYLPGGAVILDRRIDGRDHQLGFDSGAGLEPLSSTDPLGHLFPGYYAAIEKSALDQRGPRRVHFGLRYPGGLIAFKPREPDDGGRYRWRWGGRPDLLSVAVDPYLTGAPGLRLDLFQRQDDETLDPLASTTLAGATDVDRWLAGHLARSGRYRLAAHLYRRDDLFTPVELAAFDFELALEDPPDDPEGQAPRPAPGEIRLALLSGAPVSVYAPDVRFDVAIPAELQPSSEAPPLPGEIQANRLFPANPLPPAAPAARPAAATPGRHEPGVPGVRVPEFKVPEFKAPEFKVPELQVPALKVPGVDVPGGPTDRSGPAAQPAAAPAPEADPIGRYFVRLIRLPFDSYFCMRLGPLEEAARGDTLRQHAAGASLREPWQKVGADGRISVPVPRHPGRYRLKLYRLDSARGRTYAVYANAHVDFEVAVPWHAGRLSLGPQVVRQDAEAASPPGGFGIAVQAQLPAGAGNGWSAALYRPPSRLGDGGDLPRHFAGSARLDPDDPRAFLAEDLHSGQWEVLLRDPLNRVVDRARFQVAGLDPVLRIDGKLQQTADFVPIRVPRLQAPDPDWPERADPRRGLSAWQKAPFACRDPVFPTPPELRVVRLDAGDWSDADDDRFLPVAAVVPGHPYFIEAEFDAAPAADAYPLRIDGRRAVMLHQTEEPRLFRTDAPVTLVPPRQEASR
ncbi:hypothetical protein ACFOGJ_00360 [Marinibaculum pumilum]|uniref:Uncharacterized protein n=1 Tax=Marinibaculum pumilum TaxID=1766165 RepID=A0ABV7KTF1_9PROT